MSIRDARRLRLILSHLITTTHGRSVAKLESRFGARVHGTLNELTAAGRLEADLGGRVRLTLAGRNYARDVLGLEWSKFRTGMRGAA